jgi:hypothetical protein
MTAGVVMALLITEGVLRLVGYSGNFYRHDEVIGATLRPGAEGWWTREGRDYIRINSDGLRDREHSITKPANTFRIAVLGDSYAQALQLPMQKAFWSVMESKLHACAAFSDRTVEVINFGVSGYGTAQELLTLREKVWKYDPDVVLLTVNAGDDISDNSRLLKGDEDIPYFVLSDEKLVSDNSFRNRRAVSWRSSTLGRAWNYIVDRSLTAQGIREGMLATFAKFKIWSKQGSAAPNEQGLFNQVYHEPRDAAWGDAWRVTEMLMAEMSREVRNRGRQFFVITLSSPVQVSPEPKVRAVFMQQEGISDLFYPDRRIQSLCDRQSIPILALAPVLREYAEKNHVFLHGYGENMGGGHWNEQGHRVAGELIANWLCTRLSLSTAG